MDRSESNESSALRERARRAYERGRIQRALVSAIPLVVVAVIGGALARDVRVAALVGASMYVVAAVAFWRGRGLARGVLPGVAAGVVPFVAMHAARMYGHVCGGAMCFSVCIPAAALGGLVAGALIGRFARGSTEVMRSWGSAAAFAALTGALACACSGVGGVLGLVAGLLVGSVPLVVLRPAPARG